MNKNSPEIKPADFSALATNLPFCIRGAFFLGWANPLPKSRGDMTVLGLNFILRFENNN
jgi:hypothetical protein